MQKRLLIAHFSFVLHFKCQQQQAFSPLPRCLRVCQQPALLPVDTGAAVHQPSGPGAPLLPPALPLAALAPGPQDGRRAEEHRPRNLLHQQPAQVRWHTEVAE